MIMNEQELMLHQIDVFETQTGKKLEVKDGRPYYEGNLYTISDYLPDNLVVDGGLFCNYSSKKLPKGLKTKGLCVSMSDITKIPNDCECIGLNMPHTDIRKLKDNLVLVNLIAHNSSLKCLPKGLKVKGLLDISETKITEIPEDCEFGALYMSGTKITKLRDNLTLGGLIINKCSISELPKNLVVYGSLDIEKTLIKCLPDDCLATRIFCNFELKDERYEKYKDLDKCYKLKDEIVHIIHPSGREFLHVDGILNDVVEKKGNVYHIRTGVNEPIYYVVTDGNGHWAHGDTLEDAKEDLIFKISKRDKSEYESLTLDSELPYNEAIDCYRVITGACRTGTRDYIEHRLPNPRKKKYTIGEMIELTKDEYGGRTFREFFEK